jgi:hypoxanthine phosphoribosyltransferase
MKKVYYTHKDIEKLTQKIAYQLAKDQWVPDYIVGLTRGGLIPAVYLSHWLDIPMWTLKVSLRDHADTEMNAWMSEDAFGYVPKEDRGESGCQTDPALRKNILIVDDINDTGATLDWIIKDWQSSCLPDNTVWSAIWGHNVRFAVLIDNLSSKFSRKINYVGTEINKAEEPVWIVYPWELD